MKAIQFNDYGGPEVLTVSDVPKPAPGPGEILMRVRAVGVNRMDVEMRAGIYGKEPLTDFYFGKMMQFPHTPGIEPAGDVAAIGDGVDNVSVGDRVVPHSHLACGTCASCRAGWDNACPKVQVLGVQTPGKGGYAEYLSWPAKQVFPLADSLSYTDAAALLVNYGPVWFGLIARAGLRPGETLLVTGATGGCGHAAIDIGKLVGARVIAVAGSAKKAEELQRDGADIVLNYNEGDIGDAVLEATGGLGADVVCELVGADTWPQSMAAAGLRSRVVVIGSHGGVRASLNLGEVFGKNMQIIGVTRANAGAMATLVQLAGQGKLTPHVHQVLPLADAAKAHETMETRKHRGKIVLEM